MLVIAFLHGAASAACLVAVAGLFRACFREMDAAARELFERPL